jgi:hypothetical protein
VAGGTATVIGKSFRRSLCIVVDVPSYYSELGIYGKCIIHQYIYILSQLKYSVLDHPACSFPLFVFYSDTPVSWPGDQSSYSDVDENRRCRAQESSADFR